MAIYPHGYQNGDYVCIGNGERGMIAGYSGYNNYRIITPRGEVITNIMFIDIIQ